jgi:phosphopentomutase
MLFRKGGSVGRRAVIVVLDGVGAGSAPDAARFGDEGSNTLGNTARAVGGLKLRHLGALGLGNLIEIEVYYPSQVRRPPTDSCRSVLRPRRRLPGTGR